MSDSESLEYLQPGFDAKSLTIPRLRSILVAHNVPYSSSAKKAQLVEIFNEQVVPQSKKILAARARAKRSSKGIVDAESSQDSTAHNPFDEPENLAPPARAPSTRRSRSPRKTSARIKSEEPEHAALPPPKPSPSKRTARASSRQAQIPEPEPEPEPYADNVSANGTYGRRTSRRTPVPQVKKEESEEGFFRRESGAFSKENPFQSGSSPNEIERTRTPSTHRRRTLEPQGSVRRRTRTPVESVDEYKDQYAFDDAQVSDQSESEDEPEVPIAQAILRRTKTPEPSTFLEPGEEFTPEEQLELAAEEAVHGDTTVVATRQSGPPSNKASRGLPLFALVATLLAMYAAWYRQEKIAVGYCGKGQPISSIPAEISTPEWAHAVLPPEIRIPESVIERFEPVCEPCPPHAICYDDFEARCEPDYILKPHPFSLGNIVPLPPTCEPDGEKVRRVQAVADRAVEELRERTAQYECGELLSDEGTKVDTPAIEEQDLKEIINKKRSRKMNQQEFDDLWSSALGEIKSRDEVKVETDEVRDSPSVPNTYLSSTSLARIPLTCAVKRSIRLGLARYRVPIAALMMAALSVVYSWQRFVSNRAVAAQVPALVDLVLERLASQKELGGDDSDDPWLFLPNLRDDVLRSVHSLREREKIWQKVRPVVEQNSNVRTGQREGRSGEVGRAWEWIGPLAGVNEDGTRRRRSGRVSYTPDVKSDESSLAPEDRSYLHQKWGESRPIY